MVSDGLAAAAGGAGAYAAGSVAAAPALAGYLASLQPNTSAGGFSSHYHFPD